MKTSTRIHSSELAVPLSPPWRMKRPSWSRRLRTLRAGPLRGRPAAGHVQIRSLSSTSAHHGLKRQLAPSEARSLKTSTYGGALQEFLHQPAKRGMTKSASLQRRISPTSRRYDLSRQRAPSQPRTRVERDD